MNEWTIEQMNDFLIGHTYVFVHHSYSVFIIIVKEMTNELYRAWNKYDQIENPWQDVPEMNQGVKP